MDNIFKKLTNARVDLAKMNLKKSGKNKFAGFEYYELKDFLPTVNELFAKYGLCGVVSYEQETASLSIYDSDDKDSCIVFGTPMSTANLKGCHDIQNLGAVQTYVRRYLYITALEITEADALDSTIDTRQNNDSHKTKPKNDSPKIDISPSPKSPDGLISGKDAKELFIVASRKNIKQDELRNIIGSYGCTSSKELTYGQYQEILQMLEAVQTTTELKK